LLDGVEEGVELVFLVLGVCGDAASGGASSAIVSTVPTRPCWVSLLRIGGGRGKGQLASYLWSGSPGRRRSRRSTIPLSQYRNMANKITAATASSMCAEHALVEISLDPMGVVHRGSPGHVRRWFFLWSSHAAQWQCPLLSVEFTEKHVFFKSLAHSPASPEPELPLDCGV
jgi:hypothetical protein